MRDYMFMFYSEKLVSIGYTNLDFQSSKDSHRFTFDFVFTLGHMAISWRSVKQSCIAIPTREVKYNVVPKAEKEVIWLRKFLVGFWVVPLAISTMTFFFW